MAKMTIDQLNEAAKRAEARAKRFREKAKKITEAENAKLNMEILVRAEELCKLRSRRKDGRDISREDMPRFIQEWCNEVEKDLDIISEAEEAVKTYLLYKEQTEEAVKTHLLYKEQTIEVSRDVVLNQLRIWKSQYKNKKVEAKGGAGVSPAERNPA